VTAHDGEDPQAVDGEYQGAKSRADSADSAASGAERDWSGINTELLNFLADLVGITDAKNCITKGDIMACLMTLVYVLPWGKIFKVLRKIPKAAKLIGRFAKLLEKVSKARKEKEAADAALKKAEEDALKRAEEACALPNSFVAGTPVLLADGRTRPIQDVRVGDEVWATDPVTGVSEPRRVTDLIVGYGVKHLVDIAIVPDPAQSGLVRSPSTLTATDTHPFWTDGRWVNAKDLRPGDRLTEPPAFLGAAPRTPAVVGTHDRTRVERVFNFTVEGLHTYYVEAGQTSVLVHNAGCKVTGYSNHARDRMAERGISEDMVDQAVKSGRKRPGNSPGTTKFVGRNVWAVLNSRGVVVSVGRN
jgi:hypothetical protein